MTNLGIGNDIADALCSVMDELMGDCSSHERALAADKIYKLYKAENLGKESASLGFSSPAKQFGYLYNYAPLHVSAVFFYLIKLTTEDPYRETILQWCRSKVKDNNGHFHVCSLGGGPGLELACIYTWLELLGRKSPDLQVKFLEATVIDINHSWEPLFEEVLESFQRSVLTSSNIEDVHSSLIECDLLKYSCDHPSNVKTTIKKSEMVVMMKFLSAVANKGNRDQCENMLQNIMNTLKPGSLFLIIDGSCMLTKDIVSTAAFRCGMRTILEDENMFHLEEGSSRKWQAIYGMFSEKGVKPLPRFNIFVRLFQKPPHLGSHSTFTVKPKETGIVASAFEQHENFLSESLSSVGSVHSLANSGNINSAFFNYPMNTSKNESENLQIRLPHAYYSCGAPLANILTGRRTNKFCISLNSGEERISGKTSEMDSSKNSCYSSFLPTSEDVSGSQVSSEISKHPAFFNYPMNTSKNESENLQIRLPHAYYSCGGPLANILKGRHTNKVCISLNSGQERTSGKTSEMDSSKNSCYSSVLPTSEDFSGSQVSSASPEPPSATVLASKNQDGELQLGKRSLEDADCDAKLREQKEHKPHKLTCIIS